MPLGLMTMDMLFHLLDVSISLDRRSNIHFSIYKLPKKASPAAQLSSVLSHYHRGILKEYKVTSERKATKNVSSTLLSLAVLQAKNRTFW